MRCIDSFAFIWDIINKKAGGVWYLSDSALIIKQFEIKRK